MDDSPDCGLWTRPNADFRLTLRGGGRGHLCSSILELCEEKRKSHDHDLIVGRSAVSAEQQTIRQNVLGLSGGVVFSRAVEKRNNLL